MGYPVQFPAHWKPVVVTFTDVSAATSLWVHPGFRGKLKQISSVLHGAITGADANITVEIGGTAVTGAALVIANASSAAGDIDGPAIASALNSFTEAQALEVITDGASSTTMPLTVTLWLEPT
jgi:hypothetical protein